MVVDLSKTGFPNAGSPLALDRTGEPVFIEQIWLQFLMNLSSLVFLINVGGGGSEAAILGALDGGGGVSGQNADAYAAASSMALLEILSRGQAAGLTGPAASVDNALARWDGLTGRLLQNSSLVVADDGSVVNVGPSLTWTRYGTDAAFQMWRRANGTEAAPTAIASGDQIARWSARGWTSAAAFGPNSVGVEAFIALENFTGAAQGTKWRLLTTPSGTITATTEFNVDPDTGLAFGTSSGVFLDPARFFRLRPCTVAAGANQLPAAGVVGRRAYVSDALAPAYGVAVAGGGTAVVPVFDDGVNWITA